MILPIIAYGDAVLRKKAKVITKEYPKLKELLFRNIPIEEPLLGTMKDDKITMHAQAVNLARRFSIQNENDLLQVRTTVVLVF